MIGNCFGVIGYPDIDGDGVAFNCEYPGYQGHQGTDISITWASMDSGVSVLAAADGEVLWVFDGNMTDAQILMNLIVKAHRMAGLYLVLSQASAVGSII